LNNPLILKTFEHFEEQLLLLQNFWGNYPYEVEIFIQKTYSLDLNSKQSSEEVDEAQIFDSGIALRVFDESKGHHEFSQVTDEFEILKFCKTTLENFKKANKINHGLFFNKLIDDNQIRVFGNLEHLNISNKEKVNKIQNFKKYIAGNEENIYLKSLFYTEKTICELIWNNKSNQSLRSVKTPISLSSQLVLDNYDEDFLAVSGRQEMGYRSLDWQRPAIEGIELVKKFSKKKEVTAKKINCIFSGIAACNLVQVIAKYLYSSRYFSSENPFSGKIGQKIFSKKINLIENPLMPLSWGMCTWDEEGTQTRPKLFINQGTLEGLSTSIDSAIKYDLQPTGHGIRHNYQNLPSEGFHNIFIENGAKHRQEMINILKDGAFIHQVKRVNSFSFESGVILIEVLANIVKNGELAEACVIKLRMNILSVFNDIQYLGKELFWQQHYGSPDIFFANIEIVQ